MHSHITRTVLDVLVKNHPGVMSHVCGLFSRRAFNVEAILCLPQNGGEESRIWLLVNEDERLEQMIRQMRTLQERFHAICFGRSQALQPTGEARRKNLPDGDGFACDWDPRPFRLAVQ